MAGYINLVGAEDVSRAGYTMRDAAQTMAQAAGSISHSLEMHQRFLDDWIVRFTEAMQPPSRGLPMPIDHAGASLSEFRFPYKNHRGEHGHRRVSPIRIWFGSTEWHPEPQWLLRAFDLDKDAERDFALSQIASPAGDKIRSAQDEAMEASPVTAQPAAGAVSPSVAERVRRVIGGLLVAPNFEHIKDGASLRDDLGADSLDLVEVTIAIESEFGIEVPDVDAEGMLTVGDAIRYVEKVKGGDHG